MVLIVEDHDSYRSLAVLALRRYLGESADVKGASGVEEALFILEAEPVSVVVSDVMLDDGGAGDLMRRAGARLEQSAGVILVSNHGPEALAGLLSHPCARGYVSKSEGLAALADQIRQVLAGAASTT